MSNVAIARDLLQINSSFYDCIDYLCRWVSILKHTHDVSHGCLTQYYAVVFIRSIRTDTKPLMHKCSSSDFCTVTCKLLTTTDLENVFHLSTPKFGRNWWNYRTGTEWAMVFIDVEPIYIRATIIMVKFCTNEGLCQLNTAGKLAWSEAPSSDISGSNMWK